MIKAEHSIIINCPVEKVFAFAVDPAKKPEWQEGVMEAGYRPGSGPGIGAEYFEKRKIMGMEVTSKIRVIQYEPNKLFVTKLIEGPIKSEIYSTFEAVEGGTKVCATYQWELSGYLKPAEGRVKEYLQSTLPASYERLKKLLEG